MKKLTILVGLAMALALALPGGTGATVLSEVQKLLHESQPKESLRTSPSVVLAVSAPARELRDGDNLPPQTTPDGDVSFD